MNPLFADTFYFLALRNRRDEAHNRAKAITQQITGRTLVTTAWVLTEIGDALAAPANRAGFGELLQFLRSNSQVMIVPPDAKLFEQGIEFYRRRPDKAWSLTDCISFVIMTDLEISEALTADHHFEQAGFRALLK
jgi:predicted nucleic acid-binding protein